MSTYTYREESGHEEALESVCYEADKFADELCEEEG